MSDLSTLIAKRLAFDLELSWTIGREQMKVHSVHPAHHSKCHTPMAWWSAHSRGQQFERARTQSIDALWSEVIEALEYICEYQEAIHGKPNLNGLWMKANKILTKLKKACEGEGE